MPRCSGDSAAGANSFSAAPTAGACARPYIDFHEEMVRSYQHCAEVANPPPNPLSGDIVEEQANAVFGRVSPVNCRGGVHVMAQQDATQSSEDNSIGGSAPPSDRPAAKPWRTEGLPARDDEGGRGRGADGGVGPAFFGFGDF